MASRAISDTRVVMTLSLLYVFRMLGLFMVFPVLSVFGQAYTDATPFLLGVALGGYGVTQAIFQIPLGVLSDRVGRKPVIVAGLLLFVIGSVIAATSSSVWGLVLGRVVQGAGAIASAVMALLGDLTSEQNRTRAMAVVGVSIGLSFTLAMILGPALAGALGLSSVFWLSAALALVGIGIVTLLVPSPPKHRLEVGKKAIRHMMVEVMANTDLRRLDVGIFALHFALTATFVVVPIHLQSLGSPVSSHWSLYLPIMLGSFVVMIPFMYLAERHRQLKRVFLMAIATVVVSQIALFNSESLGQCLIGLFVFFVAFNLLEATLPSLVSKQAPAGSKGTAMGVYATSQFLGAALGGISGGWLYGAFGSFAATVAGAVVCSVWWLYALSMREPRYLTSLVIPCKYAVPEGELLANVPGVIEAHWAKEQETLYLKVEDSAFDKSQLHNYLGQVA